MVRSIDAVPAVMLGTGVLFTFGEPLVAMARQWGASPMYSYAYAVPAISVYLLWSRREEFRRRPVRPSRLAAAAVFSVALALLVVGEVGAIQVIQQIAFVVAIVGIVLFLFGWKYLTVSAPALAYLLFMIPLWDAFTEPLHGPFQNNSARMGVALMQAFGVPAHRDGVFIALPNVLLEVARACSGINYLIAVLALALPLAYLRLRGVWRPLVLISSALVIAALANGVRVALIGILAYYEVGSPLHGPFHMLQGLFVAGVGFVVLFAGLHVLEGPAESARPLAAAKDAPHSAWRRGEAAALATAFWTVALVGIAPETTPVALKVPLDQLARGIGVWHLDPVRSPSYALPSPWENADNHISRQYRAVDGQVVVADVWYFEAQNQSHEIVSYRTADLHRQASRTRVTLTDGSVLDANLFLRPDRKEVGLFWYDVDGSAKADQNVAKIRFLWNGLSTGRSNGAAVMLRSPAPAGAEDIATARLQQFAAEFYPVLRRHWSELAPHGSVPHAR